MSDGIGQESSTTRPMASVLLPCLAGVSVVLCLPALVTHARSRNFAATAVIFWIVLVNIFNFVNPIIWPSDELDTRWDGVGLCDIEVKLTVASSAGIPGALICIFQQLTVILDVDKVTFAPSQGQRRRRRAFEILLCIGCPLYMMIAHFLVQPYRFYIFAITGCVPPIDNSWPSIVLILVPPLLLCAIAAGYCVLVVFRLLKCRRQFSQILASSQSKLNKSRYLRLFILSSALVVIFFPISLYVFTRNLEYPRHSFSWSSVHPPGWSTFILRIPTQGVVNFDRWLNVGIGYTVFIFFGFGSDAKKMYRSWLLRLGLGKCFPKLHHPHLYPYNRAGSSATTPPTTRSPMMSSCAKAIFHRKKSSKAVPVADTSGSSALKSDEEIPSSTDQLQSDSHSERQTAQQVRV